VSILAAILILGASGSAERSMTTDASIGRIVASVAWGAVNDAASQIRVRRTVEDDARGSRTAWARLQAVGLDKVALQIDGESRTGHRAWAKAVASVIGYIADCRKTGSVGYGYRLRVRGYDIRRTTVIQDGHVLLTTDAWWVEYVKVGRSTRRIPIHVTIRITAVENAGNTVLVGAGWGVADTSAFRCGIVRRIAEQQAAEQLDAGLANALATIERGGRQFYAGGAEIADVLDGINLGIKIAGRIRR